MKDRKRYLSVEMPDKEATVEFLTDGYTVKIETLETHGGGKSVYVCVTGHDDRSTILGEVMSPIPEKDTRE